MKRLTVVSGICASFLLGTAMTAVAQDQDEHRNDKNEKQDKARPENRQEQPRPQEQSRPEDRRNQEPQSGDRKNTTPQSEGPKNQEPQSGDRHPQNRENDRQTQQQQRQQEDRQQQGRQQQQPRQGGNETGRAERRGGNQRRIPDSDFHAHFGRQHHFAPGRMQVYNGQPQFYYSGYTFALIQAWPNDWTYDADDYYVDEFDGEYWLFNLEHPGVRLELIIVE